MADRDDEALSALVGELVTALRDLEEELDPPRERGLRPPTPRELRRFTSEVAIPGAILVLETNVRALRLLQRALEASERADRTRDGAATAGERAREVGETTLERLDDALAELEAALEGHPETEEAARLVADARELRAEVQSRVDEYAGEGGAASSGTGHDASESDGTSGGTDVADDRAGDAPQVDVDAELESIKAELDEPRDGDAPTDRAGEGGDDRADDAGNGGAGGAGSPDNDWDSTGE